MEIRNGVNSGFKKIVHPQLIVIQEPVCKVSRSSDKDSAICFLEDEPEVELPITRELDVGRDPLMMSDDEGIEHFDNVGNTRDESSSTDEEVRQILSEAEKPLITQTDEKIQFAFCDVNVGDNHSTFVDKKNSINNITSTCNDNHHKQNLQAQRRQRNRTKRYSPSDWNSVSPNINKSNRAKNNTINKCTLKTPTILLNDELEKTKKNHKESLRREELTKRFHTLSSIVLEKKQEQIAKMTHIAVLKEANFCINNLKKREKFLTEKKRLLLKRNDQLNNKLLDLFED